MSFITISQYLNKLQIVFFLLLMMPLLVFIAAYFFVTDGAHVHRMEYLIIIPSAALLSWLIAVVTFNKKIKSARKAQGLGSKLDKYFEITTVRYSFHCSAGLILASGLFLTGSDIFTVLYIASLFLSLLHWPTGRRVSRELRLKGDEREMVYFRKDTL